MAELDEYYLDKTYVILDGEVRERVLLGRDYISLEDIWSHIRFWRYYRSDWQGLGSYQSERQIQVYSLDCRTQGEVVLEELIASMQQARESELAIDRAAEQRGDAVSDEGKVEIIE